MFPVQPANGTEYTSTNGTGYVYDVARNAWNKNTGVDSALLESLGINTESLNSSAILDKTAFTGVSTVVSTKLYGAFSTPSVSQVTLTEVNASVILETGNYTGYGKVVTSPLIGSYSDISSISTVKLVEALPTGVLETDDYTVYGKVITAPLIGAYSGTNSISKVELTNNMVNGVIGTGDFTAYSVGVVELTT